MSFCDLRTAFFFYFTGNDYLSSERVSKRLHSVRLHRWYASKEYSYEISFDIMISFAKLRTLQQGVIFDYYSHLGETIVESTPRNEHNR